MFYNLFRKLTFSSNFLIKDVVPRVSTRLSIDTDWKFIKSIKQQTINYRKLMAESGQNGNCKNDNSSHNGFDTVAGVSKIQNQQQQQQNRRRQQQNNEESIRQKRSFSSTSSYNYNYYNNNINPIFQQMVAMNPYQYRQQLSQFNTLLNYQMPVFQSYSQPMYFHRPQMDRQQTRSLHRKHDEDVTILNGVRYWQDLSNKNSKPGFEFTVMSYNVLAQDLLEQHPYLYNDCKRSSLKWTTRWTNLYNEITEFNPDVLCLQEVQETHLETYFSKLKHLNYDWIYKRRTGVRTDGCAIFFKTTNLNLIEHITVEYNQSKAPVLNRDNVAIIGKFTPKQSPNHEFIVATTHLLYNPKRVDVRLAQSQLLLTEIDRIAYKPMNDEHSYLPIIVTGDLNSTPDSEVYKFLVNGSFNCKHLPKRSLTMASSGNENGLIPSTLRITDQCQHADLLAKRQQNEILPRSEENKLIVLEHSERSSTNDWQDDNKVRYNDDHHLFSSGTLSHKLHLKSVYNHGDESDREGTTFQDRWVTVDYIFYSEVERETNNLHLMSRYRLPTVSQLRNVRIPNNTLGSDHLSLIAKFKLDIN